jgi:hypothetical protein
LSGNDETISRRRAMDIYYAALVRGATVRIETPGVTRGVPQQLEEEMSAALGDDPTELLAYVFRRGYKAGWKSEVAFAAVWDYCGSVWSDAVEAG